MFIYPTSIHVRTLRIKKTVRVCAQCMFVNSFVHTLNTERIYSKHAQKNNQTHNLLCDLAFVASTAYSIRCVCVITFKYGCAIQTLMWLAQLNVLTSSKAMKVRTCCWLWYTWSVTIVFSHFSSHFVRSPVSCPFVCVYARIFPRRFSTS